jgi:predicted kinase
MNINPELIILIGNIGSRKSTLTKEYVEKGYIVICRDSLRYAIGGGEYIFNLDYEPIIWDTELFFFEKFLKLGKNMIIDEVGMSKSMRKRYIDIVKLPFYPNYKVIAFELPKLSMQESVNRRLQNPHGQPDKSLWEKVWIKFDSFYESPELEEGFNEIRRI